MSEIDIILNTDIRNNGSTDVLRNDKIIFFNDINNESKLFKNDRELETFVYGDDFLDYIEKLTNKNEDNTLFAKKDNMKRLLEYVNPIIDIESVKGLQSKKNSIILDKHSISIPYTIQSSVKGKKKKYNIPANTQFKLLGLYNKSEFTINNTQNQFYNYIKDILPKNKYKIHTKEYNNKCLYTKDFNFDCLTNIEPILISKILSAFGNVELSWDDVSFIVDDIHKVILPKAHSTKELVPALVDDIKTYNSFLIHKIPDVFSENIYSSFYLDNQKELYEDIIIYSLDDEKIKSKIHNIQHYNKESKKYVTEINSINKQRATLSKLEYITKTKFSNLFNPNSKDCIFPNNVFNFDKIPKKIKDIIVMEYKKDLEYTNNVLFNKCSHLAVLNKFNSTRNDDDKRIEWNNLLKYVDKYGETKDDMFKCNICSYNIVCPHVMEYYSLTFSKKSGESGDKADLIHQIILNKFMSKSPVNFIYYCKTCGEELGKSLEMEGLNRDNESYNESSNDDMYKLIMYIVYSTTKFNNINIKLTKKQIIEFIINIISPYINNIEKKLLKSKQANIDQIITLNITLFTYASIISLCKSHHYLDIYNPNDKIIIKQKNGSRQQSFDLKSKFITAYNIILARNNKLLFSLGYTGRLESIKELLLKAYTIVDPIITENNMDLDFKLTSEITDQIILNSNIYRYLHNFKCSYPLLSNNSTKTSALKVKYDNISDVLSNYDSKLIKKESNIWNQFKIPNFTKDNSFSVEKINKINSISEYKYCSMLLFIYFIQNELFRLSPYGESDNEKYNLYKSKIQILKDYEHDMVDNNLLKYLYPYSHIKSSNIRYYYKNNINLGPFICQKTGHLHKYNNYVFIIDNKEEVINIKKLDKNIERIVSGEFKDYKCSDCGKYKNDKYDQGTNKQIEDVIYFKNNISNFYNIYKYKCPKSVYHNFIEKNEVYSCSICDIKFLEIINEDESVYKKFKKEYEIYMNSITDEQNKEIKKNKIETYKLYNENIIDLYRKEFTKNEYTSFLNKIENIKLIDLEDEIAIITNSDRKNIKLIGDTEGSTEEELEEKNSDYNAINNLFMKISEHIRTITIYYNILTSNKNLNDYDIFIPKEFIDVYENLKHLKLTNKYNININSLYDFLRLTNNDNIKIVELGKKILFSFIIFIYKDNKDLKSFVDFCVNKILLTDVLYTKFNYAQLKQMFVESNVMDEMDDFTEEYEDDGDELFEYEDLSMNNFEDDNIDD